MNHKLANGMKIGKLKRVYYHITVFLEKTLTFTPRKKRKSEHQSDGKLEEHSLHNYEPANKQHTYQSTKFYSPSRTMESRSTASFTSTYPQTYVKYHRARLGVTFGQYVKSPSR
jgi:hypothetical protein